MSVIKIFTDGACRGNPGPGGWAALIEIGDQKRTLSGAALHTTNNRMELEAVIQSLSTCDRPTTIMMTTDSKYVKLGATAWLPTWKKNSWKNSRKAPVKNAELWRKLDALMQPHDITWIWVKGHSGHPENTHVDLLANRAIDNLLKSGVSEIFSESEELS